MQSLVSTPTLDQLEGFLRTLVERLEEEPVSGPRAAGRPIVLSSRCLWLAFLVCLLRGLRSQRAVWRLLGLGPLWCFEHSVLTSQAIYKRLDTAGTGPLETLFAQLSTVLLMLLRPLVERAEREGTLMRLAPFAPDILALDETILDQVARRLPLLRGVRKGSAVLLPGKLVALFSVRYQQWRRIHFEPDAQQNEKVSARLMLEGLAKGTLLLGDLGFFCFHWFDDLTDLGLYYVSRLRADCVPTPLHTFYQQDDTFDGLVRLGSRGGPRAKHAVRLVQFRHNGLLHRYLTNVCDPQQLSMHDIATLYARRWDIELAFLTLKKHLGLALFWSAKTHVLLQQVWGALIIAQLLQAWRLQTAIQAQVDPYEVSLPLLIEYLPTLSAYGLDSRALLVARGRDLGFIRPSSRLRIQTPDVTTLPVTPVPADLVWEQEPYYPPDRPGRKRSPKKKSLKQAG